jgi:hypothetical protein
MRYGISEWKARRWIFAAHRLEKLPRTSEALGSGELGIDKVTELCRFATPETEDRLLRWAVGVSVAAVRRRADLEIRKALQDVLDAERSRRVSWWYFDEGRRFGLEAELPAAQGAVVVRALERVAESLPAMPGEEDPLRADARRADALVAIASGRLAAESDADRATVVVHASVQALASGEGAAELEDGPAIHPETARRLACHSRIQTVVEDEDGNATAVGHVVREPPPWMMRQLRYRDRGCVFPGCGSRRFVVAHHVVFWAEGGRTQLDNLVLLCSFHHRLVHEGRWRLRRDASGLRWLRPDGVRYRAGPAPPPRDEVAPSLELAG